MRAIRNLILLAAAGAGLSACTDGYGYSGVSLGYGAAPGYYDDYYAGGYGGYSGYGSPYWGWWGDYYYPGTGYYVYDRWNRPYRWNDRQRDYWDRRRNGWRGGNRAEIRDNWQDFRRDRRSDDRAYWRHRGDDRRDYRQGNVTREQFRAERRDDRQDYRREYRQDRRDLYRQNRRDRRR